MKGASRRREERQMEVNDMEKITPTQRNTSLPGTRKKKNSGDDSFKLISQVKVSL